MNKKIRILTCVQVAVFQIPHLPYHLKKLASLPPFRILRSPFSLQKILRPPPLKNHLPLPPCSIHNECSLMENWWLLGRDLTWIFSLSILKKIDTPESFIVLFFTRKVTELLLLFKDFTPFPELKIMKLLIFVDFFPQLRHSKIG